MRQPQLRQPQLRQPQLRQPHRSSASLTLGLYTALIVYASLYPFSGWRDQGLMPFDFLTAPWPRYWSQFDTVANFVGYVPLGFLMALALLRTTVLPRPVLLATLAASALSLCMESLQTYIPQRIPALSDWLLNTLGACAGAWLAGGLEHMGTIDHWSRFRARWFTDDARGALVLLAIWPFALLFPASVPLGLGQVFERAESTLEGLLAGSAFLYWLPVRSLELQPMVPLAEMLCVALGLLAPCLLGYAIVLGNQRRALFFIAACAISVMASGLSTALTYGPEHAWGWLTKPVLVGWFLGCLLALASLTLPRRACLALLLVALVWQLGMLNLAPSSPYFAQTLQGWEQGRFIRFNGLAQWIGWLWPYAALGLAVMSLSRRA